jgi:hypothetical protein
MSNKYDLLETYKKWWLNKYIRPKGSERDYRLCVDIKIFGPPSGFTAIAELKFADGGIVNLPRNPNGMRPVKKEMEAKENNNV